MPSSSNGGAVAWKIATGALGVFLISMAGMWGMVTVHADTTHKDSVGRNEFKIHADTVYERLNRIEAKLDAALVK